MVSRPVDLDRDKRIRTRVAINVKVYALVQHTTCCPLVSLEGVGSEEQESGAGIDDACGRAGDRGRAVLDGLVDTPVEGRGRGGGDGCEGDGAGELGGVGAAEGELAVGGGLGGRRLEGDTDEVGGDEALGEGVVDDWEMGNEFKMSEIERRCSPVGISELVAGLSVPCVRSTGPMLYKW